MSSLESEVKIPTTNNPRELAQYLRSLKDADPTMTVEQAWESYICPGHDMPGVRFALREARFSTAEISEYFAGSNTPPRDGSI